MRFLSITKEFFCGMDYLFKIFFVKFESFSKDINNGNEDYGIETKTTGMIQFYNVNKYENLTSGYKSKNFKTDDEDDYEIID